jgi:uncharacterized protein YdiU (UPF0061 family)
MSSAPIPFDNRYARLPERFYTRQSPTPVRAPALIRVNRPLAERLGIDARWLESSEGVEVLAGNRIPAGAEPIATAYAGHQFGGWNPQLGDGRAVLLGEVVARDGCRYDIQLKGAGRTAWSRGGDGRSPLGPVLREYIVSEAMAVLGVPTTRSLAAVASGEPVMRDDALPGGVLTRVASSHIRIGTFQYFSARNDIEAVRLLAEHVIERHFPECAAAENRYLALLQAVIAAQAALIAQWQSLGFIHGVMNTDNMLLCGETVDYGPCAFIDDFHPAKVFSSIDRGGRYAWRNQPGIAQWNLAWLAQALLPLLDDDEQKALTLAQQAIETFASLYEQAWHTRMVAKLGLTHINDDNIALIDALLLLMGEHGSDFTLTFRRLAELADTSVPGLCRYELPAAFDPWLQHWRARLAAESMTAEPVAAAERRRRMEAVNPLVIARNHQVEKAIRAAEDRSDFAPFHQLVERLQHPFDSDPADFDGERDYALPPKPEQVVAKTFCGT